ncbi:phosphatidylinositol-4,5-diphosphate 3-kinase [Pelomyxa schiedti]|nr:phosphatidylinositol-4,5-diphosphate 3-kinase [Pelomyxa schiedti]
MPRVGMQGWLTKKGQKRFFIVIDDILFWFLSEEACVDQANALKKARNLLPLVSGTAVGRVGKTGLMIRGAGGKLYKLTAETEQEALAWISFIKEVIVKQRAKIKVDSHAEKRGYLSHRRTTFFFVLAQGSLSWFKSEQASVVKGRLPLSGTELDSKVDSTFTLRRGSDHFEFTAKNVSECNDWCKDITAAILFVQEQARKASVVDNMEVSVRCELSLFGEKAVVYMTTAVTANGIKEATLNMLQSMLSTHSSSRVEMINPDFFLLKVEGIDFYCIPEGVPLRTMPLFQLCEMALARPRLQMLHKQSLNEDHVNIQKLVDHKEIDSRVLSEIRMHKIITKLLGNSYTTNLCGISVKSSPGTVRSSEPDDTGILETRSSLIRHVKSIQQTMPMNRLPEYLNREPLPKNIPPQITVFCALPLNFGKKTVTLDCSMTAEQAKHNIFEKYQALNPQDTNGRTLSDYHLKVTGFRSYMIGNNKLIDYDYIRSCLNRGVRIELSLFLIPLNFPQEREQVSFANTILAQDLPEEHAPEVLAPPIPLSTLDRKFRIKIVGLPNIYTDVMEQLVNLETGTTDVGFFVLVELCHGELLLDEPLKTPPVRFQHQSSTGRLPVVSVTFNQWLAFNIEMFNLPKVTKLCFTLFATQNTGPDEGKELPMGWVNFQLITHNNKVLLGHRSLKLWNEGRASHVGTTCENTTTHNPTVLEIEFENLKTAVVFSEPTLTAVQDIPSSSSHPPTPSSMASTIPHLLISNTTSASSTSTSTTPSSTAPTTASKEVSSPPPVKMLPGGLPGLKRLPPASTSPSGTTPTSWGSRSSMPVRKSSILSGHRGTITDQLSPIEIVRGVISQSSLTPISKTEKELLYTHRDFLKTIPAALSKFLLSVNWANRAQVSEAHRLLKEWAPISHVQALQLLGGEFADATVRAFAVNSLESVSDGMLSDFLLQLTNVLKYEPYHDCALLRFLIRRALRNRDIIGHPLFWFIKAEMTGFSEMRYGLCMEAFLRGCGDMYLSILDAQVEVVGQLAAVATTIKQTKRSQRMEVLQYELRRLDLPPRFQLPLFPDRECSGLRIRECKAMKSKMAPLWLVFDNIDLYGDPINIIYKQGDDLRQDVLTLQMIKLMDKLWIESGVDMKMTPYGVLVTSEMAGMVEAVLRSDTTATINRKAGGPTAVLRQDTMDRWLKTKHPDPVDYKHAAEQFMFSCAGYCVATFVLGIGDRHNDNIMVNSDGRLFHIDFGHFLGHFKKKYGINREKAPFVFTPQFACIIGGEGSEMYNRFATICERAYNVIRHNAELFITLFSLMLATGLPELNGVEDIMWLHDHFLLQKTDVEAAEFFRGAITESLHTKTTQVMDMIHIWAN